MMIIVPKDYDCKLLILFYFDFKFQDFPKIFKKVMIRPLPFIWHSRVLFLLHTPCISDPVKTNKPAGIPDKSQPGVVSSFHPTVGSGYHPQTNLLCAGRWLKCQRGAESSHYLAGMSRVEISLSRDDWVGHWYRAFSSWSPEISHKLFYRKQNFQDVLNVFRKRTVVRLTVFTANMSK